LCHALDIEWAVEEFGIASTSSSRGDDIICAPDGTDIEAAVADCNKHNVAD
jgi:hypothetical protein